MKNVKRYCVLLAILMAWLTVMGSAAAAPAEKELLQSSYKKFMELKNYHINIVTQLSCTVNGQRMEMVIVSDSDMQSKPLVGKNNMTIKFTGGNETTTQLIGQYFEEVNGKMMVYTKTGGIWQLEVVPSYDPADEYSSYIKGAIGAEKIAEDHDTVLLRVTADGKTLGENLDKYLTTLNMPNLKLTPASLQGMSSFTYDMTISKTTGQIKGLQMDLSQILKEIGYKMLESRKLPAQQQAETAEMLSALKVEVKAVISRENASSQLLKIPVDVREAAAAAAKTQAEETALLKSRLGMADISKILAESDVMAKYNGLIKQRSKELSAQLILEGPSLTEAQMKVRMEEINTEYREYRSQMYKQAEDEITRAINAVKAEKKIGSVFYKQKITDKAPDNSIDITEAVLEKLRISK